MFDSLFDPEFRIWFYQQEQRFQWYKENIPITDKRYEEYLETLEEEN